MSDDTQTLDPEQDQEEQKEKETVKKESPGQLYPHTNKDSRMNQLFQEISTPPEPGDIIEGEVVGIDNYAVFIDLPPFGTGMIYGRELMHARDIIKRVGIGDTVSGKVVETNNEWGYIEISLKEARQAIIWEEAEEALKNRSVFELTVEEANKGGLLMSWQGIQGFLPASQLSSEHYPKVEDSDKDKILEELRRLVGEKMTVSIITALPREGKIIFSEKHTGEQQSTEAKEKSIEKYAVGDVVEGEVTGIVDFGIFVKIDDNLEGLVHISEIDWGLVEDLQQMFSVGEKTQVKIIEIKDEKVSLSIKALKENPWKEAGAKYKEGQEVEGVIIKFNKHGALASIEEGVAGLVHVSEFGNEEKLRESLELGKNYPFVITYFNPEEQKMTLSYKKEATTEETSEEK